MKNHTKAYKLCIFKHPCGNISKKYYMNLFSNNGLSFILTYYSTLEQIIIAEPLMLSEQL